MIDENLNADISSVVDLINIKNLPEMISDYLHSKESKKFGNLRKFYSSMLDCFSEDIKESYLNRILKYLSSENPSNIYLIDYINEGIYDKELKTFVEKLVKEINLNEDSYTIYELINKKMNFAFFDSDTQFCTIKDYHNDKNYHDFMFSLIKHAFKNYQKTLPAIMAKSLYVQSQTMIFGSSGHIRYLNASSTLGNDEATMTLFGILFSNDYNLSTKILTRAKDNEVVLWSVAFNLENNYLNKETIELMKTRFKYVFNDNNDFIDKISVTEIGKKYSLESSLLLGVQMHYYTYNKFNFTKSGNSLGKLLIFDIISYDNNREKSIEMGKQFLSNEIKRGNINAITNLAVYMFENKNDKDYDYKKIKKSFETSASFCDLQGNYYYGRILFEEGKYEAAYKHLLYASNNNSKQAMKLLGEYYELKNDVDNAISCYKKAILNNNFDAAYNLALLYFNLTEIQKDNTLILNELGADYIKKYYNLFSDEIKKKAAILLDKKF